MKAFLFAAAAAIVLALAAQQVLQGRMQMTAPQAFSTEGARISPPNGNLVNF